jgi:glutamate formiminotransferase/formiminotetrahydrofolate cyclodeaminase
LIKKAQELIDMRSHKGEHPTVRSHRRVPLGAHQRHQHGGDREHSRKLAERVGVNWASPCTATKRPPAEEKRRNLANNRSGEYEGLPKKLSDPAWKPDFGPAAFTDSVARSGAIAIGARNFLVAYNVNLNTPAPAAPTPSPSISVRQAAK